MRRLLLLLRRLCVHAALLVSVSAFVATRGAAQEPPAVQAAKQLRDAGRYGAAADGLLGYLRQHPEDAGTRWLAAQLLYRDGRSDAAREQYEASLALTPADPWLRLEFGDVLLALGAWDRAAAVVEPVLDLRGAPPAARARAQTLLGTRAYWRGDLGGAMRRFEAALALDPSHEAARSQLDEVRTLIRPWIGTEAELLDDSQPYRRLQIAIDGGVYVNPLWTVAIRGASRTLESTVTSHTLDAAVELRGFLPEAALSLATHVGGAWQSGLTASPRAIGGGELGIRLGRGVTLRASGERERYLSTRAAADSVLMVDALVLRLDRAAAPGWAGEAVVRRETFADANAILTVYGWVLAPLASALRVGYALAWQDAEETRWSPALGRYQPYFTPERQLVHSALAEVSAHVSGATGRLNGSWGVRATEDAPADRTSGVPRSSGAATGPAFTERSFTPWSVRATLDRPVTGRLALRVEAERQSTAFYQLTRASLSAVHHFGGPRAR